MGVAAISCQPKKGWFLRALLPLIFPEALVITVPLWRGRFLTHPGFLSRTLHGIHWAAQSGAA